MNDKALIIKEHEAKHDLVFVRPEDLETQRMFVTEITVLRATPDDFHSISGNRMPKGYYTCRIGEAAGVSFIAENCGTRKESENVYVGFAQGKRRLPDGTWRTSAMQEYEFDVEARAQEDFLKDSQAKKEDQKYSTEISKQQHILELKRFARQKAGTGAHLKVIRELVGIPISFKPDQIHKAIVVSRVAVNTDELLSTPGMQQAAIQQAIGAQQQLFGPGQGNLERDVTGEPAPVTEASAEAPAAPEEPVPFQDDIPWEEKPEDVLRRGLQHYLDNNVEVYLLPEPPLQLIKSMLDNKDATEDALRDCDKRIKDYIARRERGNPKYADHMQAMREAGRVVA